MGQEALGAPARVPLSCQLAVRNRHLLLYDSQTTIRGISALFAQERCQDWEAQESGNVYIKGRSGEAWAGSAVFQAGVMAKNPRVERPVTPAAPLAG